MKLKLPNWGSLCNPNLLMNCDYRSGIINQKGETSYAYVDKALLTIDGWISYGVNVGLDADSIRIINRQTSDRTLRQYVEGKSGTYTVYVNVKSITGNVYVNFNQDISKNKKLVKGKNIFQITLSSSENLSSFTLLLEANADIYIHCMKLEPGEHFTGMPAWNESIELLKCYAKYYCFNAQPNINNNKYMLAVQVATNKARMTIDLPTQINKTPSVKLGYLYIVGIATGAWHLVTSVTAINYVGNKLTLYLQTQDNISSSVNNPVYALFTKDGYLEVDMYDYD